MDDLLAWDPDAFWDAGTQEVVGGCSRPELASADLGHALMEERKALESCKRRSVARQKRLATVPSLGGTIHITNLLSFFITSYTRTGPNLYINAVLIGSGGLFQPGPVPVWWSGCSVHYGPTVGSMKNPGWPQTALLRIRECCYRERGRAEGKPTEQVMLLPVPRLKSSA